MSFHSEQLRELTALIKNEVESTQNIILQGIVAKDFASYKEQVGRLYAYDKTLKLVEQARELVEQRE